MPDVNLPAIKANLLAELRHWRDRPFSYSDATTDVLAVVEPLFTSIERLKSLERSNRHDLDLYHEQLGELRYERNEAQDNHSRACVTISEMHAAAVGEVTGPKRGVVEDVADLRTRMLALEDMLETAWGIICNVGIPEQLATSTPPYADGWAGQGAEWELAASLLRDRWHAHLSAYAVRTEAEAPL